MAFKEKVIKNKTETKQRMKAADEKNANFIKEHREALVRFLGEDLTEDIDEQDIDWCIYQLSTALFDRSHGNNMSEFVEELKAEFGGDIYTEVLEGFILHNHDT